MTLTPLFQNIQIGCLAASGALLAGALYGMATRAADILPADSARPRRTDADKRRADRMPCNVFVELLQGEKVAGTGRMVNLSASGLCFSSISTLRPGDHIRARLPGMRNGTSEVSGKVIWHKMTSTHTLYGIRLNESIHS